MARYTVTRTIHLTYEYDVEADSAREAALIAEERGSVDADRDSTDEKGFRVENLESGAKSRFSLQKLGLA